MRDERGKEGRKDRLSAVLSDRLAPKGRVEVFVTKGTAKLKLGNIIEGRIGVCPIYDEVGLDFSSCEVTGSLDVMNIIVNQGKDQAVKALATGLLSPILRMAIGDRGALTSDSTMPKTPLATQTALFNEIYRADMDAVSVNIGTPTIHRVQFIKTFSAVLVPLVSFSNQASPVINEIGLITAPAGGGANPFPRAPVAAPAAPVADELLFSIRTFKSVPFEAANDVSVTIRYTIFQE